MTPTLEQVLGAKKKIAPIITRTPLKRSLALTKKLGRPVALKMETMQATGAFKLRGASNAILSLTPEQKARGVVTASSGNHGRAVAYVARELGLAASICLSELVPQSKIDAIASLEADVLVGGKDQDAAMIVAHELAQQKGMAYIDPFDDLDVIVGQATIGVEILEDNPEVDTLVIPVSGGGLLSGVAWYVKMMKPSVKIVGVSMERGAAMYHSLQAGKPVLVEELTTVADALQGGIGLNNRFSFSMCRDLIDDLILLSEEQIKDGMAHAFRDEHLVLEGSGACGIALLLNTHGDDLGTNIVTICSGDNIDPKTFLDIVSDRL